MSCENFIPTVWAEGIQRELERRCVFMEDCNRQFEGKVKKRGGSVVIPGIGRPSVKTISRDNAGDQLDNPQKPESTSTSLVIDYMTYYNYLVDDVDEVQASGSIREALQAETSEVVAQEIDRNIARLVLDNAVKKTFTTVPKIVLGTASSNEINVLDALDEALLTLEENDVSDHTPIIATVSPRYFKIFKREYSFEDTNNSGILKNGKIGSYSNVTIKRSNSVAKTQSSVANDTDNIMVRTQRAVAFAMPYVFCEALRANDRFSDIVRGFSLYGMKIVRPKEIVNLNVKLF